MATWEDTNNENYKDFKEFGDSDDTAYGYGGNDTIYGWKGNDTLYGGKNHDELYGDQHADDLYGGKGKDNLYGGEEDDYFYFELKDTGDKNDNKADTIHDFEDVDVIWLKGSYDYVEDDSSPEDGQYSIWQDGSDWVVTYNSSSDDVYHDIIVKGDNPLDNIEFF
jgi:hemolysin type calcium-binding protein